MQTRQRDLSTGLRSVLLAALVVSFIVRAADVPARAPAQSNAENAIPGQRVFVCGHSFHVYIAKPMEEIAKAAGISHHENLGVQFLGGSSVTQHWDLPDEKNKTKQALNTGNVDVLTLSPNWIIPDPAIDHFVDLALKKNPKTRIVVQMSWPAFDAPSFDKAILKNEERDSKTVADIEAAMNAYKPAFEKQMKDINDRLGRTVITVAPVGKALLALREKVIKGEAPGVSKQSELFADPLGHGKEAVQRLAAYCCFATIYQKSPVGLPTFEKPGNDNWNKLNRMLQELAWESICSYPLSGMVRK